MTAQDRRGRRRLRRDDAVAYDFTRPVKLTREHARLLENAMEAYARQASSVLSVALRTICHVRLESLEQLTYVELVDRLEDHTFLSTVALPPLASPGIWQAPISAVMSWVDLVLGGHGRMPQPERALTEIETEVLGEVAGPLLSELATALEPVLLTAPAMEDVAYRPGTAHLVRDSAVLVVATFEVRQGELTYRSTLSLPFAALLPHLDELTRERPPTADELRDRRAARTAVDDNLRDVPLEVTVRCRPTIAPPHLIASLQPGDVVRLAHPADAPLDVVADEVVVARGSAGTQGDHLACLVVSTHLQEHLS